MQQLEQSSRKGKELNSEEREKKACKVELSRGSGSTGWRLKLAPGDPCRQTLEELAQFLGLASKSYLARHIEPGDKKQEEILEKTKS